MTLRYVDNPARDVASLDITARHINRAIRAVTVFGCEKPPIVEWNHVIDGKPRHTRVLFESMQVTGSFKIRGAVAAIEAHMSEAKARGVVAASAGNHGAGVAYASAKMGVRATIVVPTTTPNVKRDRIAKSGATLVVHGAGYDAAEAHALAIARDADALFISAYDDVDVAAGNGGTLGGDLIAARGGAKFSRVIVPVGGGGLASGMAAALGPDVAVYGAQSDACPAMAESIARGSAIESMHARELTLAEGLEGGVTRAGFERARRALAGVFVVSETSIARAMIFAREQWGVVVEGSAAVALVPFLEGDPRADDSVIVLTGRNVDA